MALIALVNLILGWVGAQFGFVTGEGETLKYLWTLEGGLGWLFQPIAWLIGIEWADCRYAGQLLGLKMATNEFVAYGQLAEWSTPESTVEI